MQQLTEMTGVQAWTKGPEMNYHELLEHSYALEREMAECPADSRLEYLSQNIFDFTTYDSAMDELFAKKAVEVCEAITNGKTFDYISNHESHVWYLALCNMPFFAERLDWGTSIRGAWWGPALGKQICLASCGLWTGDKQATELRFSRDEWEEFICAVIAFASKPE